MKTFISLLRGINVSGQNRIRMPELKGVYESLNLVNVVTYIQSGNVVFDCAEQDPAELARSIEAEIARTFGASVRVILRDKDRFQQIINSNPFSIQRNEDPEKLHITFLSDSPSESALSNLPVPGGLSQSLKAWTSPPPDPRPRAGEKKILGCWRSAKPPANTPNPEFVKTVPVPADRKRSGAGNGDEFQVFDKEIYLFCPNGYGRTKISNSFFERKLSVSATTRNWKTVKALFEIANQR